MRGSIYIYLYIYIYIYIYIYLIKSPSVTLSLCLSLCLSLWSLSVTISCNVLWRINYSDMDEGINPNPFVNERYGCWLHIKTILGSWSPSQESGTSSKVRKGSWFFPKFFYSFSRCFSMFWGILRLFFFKKIFGNKFFEKWLAKFRKFWRKKMIFFFYIFQCFWIFWGVWELLGGAGGGEAPCGGRRPPQEQEARRASMFLSIYIYMKRKFKKYMYCQT